MDRRRSSAAIGERDGYGGVGSRTDLTTTSHAQHWRRLSNGKGGPACPLSMVRRTREPRLVNLAVWNVAMQVLTGGPQGWVVFTHWNIISRAHHPVIELARWLLWLRLAKTPIHFLFSIPDHGVKT